MVIKMKKHNLSLTYAPKIAGVRAGTIRQTIRTGRKFSVGDLVSFHGWEGRPYRSRWSFRTPYAPLLSVENITIYPLLGIVVHQPQGGEEVCPWGGWAAASIALHDGIDPPTGAALRAVLLGLNPIPDDGAEAQIIRW